MSRASFARRATHPTQSLLLVLLALSLLATLRVLQDLSAWPQLHVPRYRIYAVEGVLREDMRALQGGGRLVPIMLEYSLSQDERVSASGPLDVYLKSGTRITPNNSEQLYQGQRVRLYGSFSGERFAAHRVVLFESQTTLVTLRSSIRDYLHDIWDGSLEGELAMALLIGVRPPSDSLIIGYFKRSGLMFLLALSGMHISFLLFILEHFLFFLPTNSKLCVSVGVGLLFLLLVGFKPSLCRGVLMFAIARYAHYLGYKLRLVVLLFICFLVQLCFFPSHLWTLAFVLSYGTLLAMALLGSWAIYFLPWILPAHLRKALGAGIGAGGFVLPSSYLAFGSFYPSYLIGSYVMTPLVFAYMGIAMVWVVYPPLGLLLARPCYALIIKMLRFLAPAL